MNNLDDRNEAIDQILTKLYEHLSNTAFTMDLPFNEYLASRIAVRSPEFNTAINAPGLTANSSRTSPTTLRPDLDTCWAQLQNISNDFKSLT